MVAKCSGEGVLLKSKGQLLCPSAHTYVCEPCNPALPRRQGKGAEFLGFAGVYFYPLLYSLHFVFILL